MNFLVSKYLFVIVLLSIFIVEVNAQKVRSYRKDSLQIKAYSEITYDNFKVTDLKVTKIFCDYCTENQLKAIKHQAWQRSYYDRYSAKNRMQKGKKKLALYIRVSKKDFLLLKEEDNNN